MLSLDLPSFYKHFPCIKVMLLTLGILTAKLKIKSSQDETHNA